MLVDDTEYNSKEQSYKVQTCIDNNKPQLANGIMQVKTGRDAMRIGSEVRPFIDWSYNRSIEIMKRG